MGIKKECIKRKVNRMDMVKIGKRMVEGTRSRGQSRTRW